MTPADRFIELIVNLLPRLSIFWVVKALFIAGLGLYVAFAIIVLRQVGLMSKTLENNFNPFLKLIAWVHLLGAIFSFLLAWVIL